jgi:hypothetical protein
MNNNKIFFIMKIVNYLKIEPFFGGKDTRAEAGRRVCRATKSSENKHYNNDGLDCFTLRVPQQMQNPGY